MTSDAARVDLEVRISFQEDAIRVLEDEVCAQRRRIEALELQCRRLAVRLEELTASLPDPATEPPPHY